MKRVCIVGCGAIGSLYAAHLARVADVWAFVRREDHARALNREGLRVTGHHEFHVSLRATSNPRDLPDCDLAIVATKATQVQESIALIANRFDSGAVISAQNGLGSEEIIAEHARGQIIRGTTFMSGTRHSDTHVQYELDTATWLGPFEPRHTPYDLVKQAADLIVASGLKAEALQDARPAQWSKLIFNSSVNSVSALTGLPHSPRFSERRHRPRSAACRRSRPVAHRSLPPHQKQGSWLVVQGRKQTRGDRKWRGPLTKLNSLAPAL